MQVHLQIAILLTTYNGARFLDEQIQSIVGQTHAHWTIYASDDGSSDETLAILLRHQKALGVERLAIYQGPQQGFAQNFMSLVRNPAIYADYYAFCDQDDVWLPDKLARSVQHLAQLPKDKPALYGSRTVLIDESGKALGMSPLFRKPPGLENALVQNIAGGNTMLFNEGTRHLLVKTAPNANIVAHDWLAYLVTAAAQGTIVYDAKPSVLYRQHGNNLIGANNGLKNKLIRLARLHRGDLHHWIAANLIALEGCQHLLPVESRIIIENFRQARQGHGYKRWLEFANLGLYRQTLLGNLGLAWAILTGKI